MAASGPGTWFMDFVLRRWYTFINRSDVDGVLHFMNYGYHSDSEPVQLDAADEAERYPIQLYHHVASLCDLRGKDLLEVGCGRGGGISYIFRSMAPRTALGVDLNPEAIDFCRRSYPAISFEVMDAQDLRCADSSVDAVLNVESSHRYPNFARFASEVYRVLRPGGSFLFTDFRHSEQIDGVVDAIERAGFTATVSEVINDPVLAALRLDRDRRVRLIEQFLPALLRGAALEFAGTPGTKLYRSFESGGRTYVCMLLTK